MSHLRRKFFWAFDFLILLLAFAACTWLAPFIHAQLSPGGRFHGSWLQAFDPADSSLGFPPLSQYLWVFFIMAPANVMCIDILGGHEPIRRQRTLRILLIGIASPLVATGLLSEVLFVLKSPLYSRIFVISFATLSGFATVSTRFVGRFWHQYLLRQGMYAEEVAIIATPEIAQLIAERFGHNVSQFHYKLIGYFNPGQQSGGTNPLPLLGGVAELEHVLIHEPIQRVVMALPEEGTPWLKPALDACDYFRVAVQIVPETLLTANLKDLTAKTSAELAGLPALTLTPPEWESDWLYIKRLLDVFVSASLLVLLLPLFALIAVAIKLTTPELPVFYPWRVVGYRGRRFTGYKFTTMVADADDRKSNLAKMNEMSGPVFKIANDPRVTPLGKFLRKYSLNELPQLWSVLKGDMSLVGPRPSFPNELARYELWQKRKLSTQPGLTCYWQIRGRNKISNFDDWVRLDLEYIRTRSLWIDCKILAKTAWVVVRGTGS